MTAVMLACLSGDADLLMLLEQGGDPEAKDKGGWTPLIYAAYGGNLECVKVILETGASKKTKDKHKRRATGPSRQRNARFDAQRRPKAARSSST
ncbi:hypothetical protein JL722_14714 [Aureococcus anophagefferens]|nr:hypothetical protein JL722_14714 [Aureococcus anophagefferens]